MAMHLLVCLLASFCKGVSTSPGLRGTNTSLAAVDRRLNTYSASTSRFFPGDTAGTTGHGAACGGANLNTVTSTLDALTSSLGRKYFAIAPSQNMVQPLTCSSANEDTGSGSPSKDAGSYASADILHLHCGQCIVFVSDVTAESVGGIVFDTCPATQTNADWCTKNGVKNHAGYYNHLDFYGLDSEHVTSSIGDNPTGTIFLVECPSALIAAITELAAAKSSSESPVCNFWYDTSSQVSQGSPGQDVFGCAECDPTPAAITTITTTTMTTTSEAVSSCKYSIHANTAVRFQGTGGDKLKHANYASTDAYLAACQANCNADSSCGGFVDDPKGRRGRMCKPKTASSGYSKPQKTFYRKGSGC